MLRQFNRFILLALVTVGILYLTLANSDRATLYLGPALQITTNAGVLYLGIFATGCIVASIVAMFFGFKGYMRERTLRSQERTRQAFFELFVKARDLMAAHEWNSARNVWEQVLRKDSDNVIARVELATCLNALGDTREALRIVDSLRAEKRSNAEVLFKAAELNQTLGNFTAARDNIALIVSNFPSKRALERARDLSEQMNRIEDALEYHEEIERASYTDADSQRTKTRLLLALLLKQSPTDAALLEGLSGFVKRHPGCVEALERLGALEIKAGRFEAAAELLVKAAKASGDDPEKWFQVVDLWISKAPGDFAKRAERALAAGRSAARAGSGVARLKAELLLCRTLIALHRHEEALTAVESLPALAEREGAPMPDELKEAAITLKGLCLARLGRLHETNSLWQDLAASRGPTLEERSSKRSHPHKVEPSPTLSTP